jgi:hypothetical protein
MFIAALFTIAKLWKQPRCPTTDEWIKKMWYLYTIEFYLATKKNEILSFAGKWIEQISKVRLRNSKIACSPSYADFKSKTNAVILLDTGHTKGRLCLEGIGQRKDAKNLNVVDVLTVSEGTE